MPSRTSTESSASATRRPAVVDAARAAQRGKVVWEPVGDELEDALGLRQACKLVAAEIAHGRLGECGRAGRQEHLAAVAGRADARRAVHVEADEAVAGIDRGPCVQAHPDAHGGAVRPGLGQERALRVERGSYRDGRRVEDGEELVRATLDLAPAMVCGSGTELHARGGQDVAVSGAEAPDERGRPLDVGEEEGELLLRHGLEASSTPRA